MKGWLPRRLGGGLGGTRRGGPDVNIKHSGREDNERERERYRLERERETSGRLDRDRLAFCLSISCATSNFLLYKFIYSSILMYNAIVIQLFSLDQSIVSNKYVVLKMTKTARRKMEAVVQFSWQGFIEFLT